MAHRNVSEHSLLVLAFWDYDGSPVNGPTKNDLRGSGFIFLREVSDRIILNEGFRSTWVAD